MQILKPQDIPISVGAAGAEARTADVGGMSVTFYRFPKGLDLRMLMQGLAGGRCACPHWAYVISGKMRIHTSDGTHDVASGEAFYVEPGHVPEALEETTMFEVSPSAELHDMEDHLRDRLKALQRS